jgi:hypothetical protein
MRAAANDNKTSTAVAAHTVPTMSWACSSGKMYTAIMFDASNSPSVGMVGQSGKPMGKGWGFLHMAKINVPCASGTAAAMTSGEVLGGQASAADPRPFGTYFPPSNPAPTANNYGVYIFEQDRAFVRNTSTPALVANLSKLGGVVNLPQFVSALGVISKGPVARTWAWLNGSPVSASNMEAGGPAFAAYAKMACTALNATPAAFNGPCTYASTDSATGRALTTLAPTAAPSSAAPTGTP